MTVDVAPQAPFLLPEQPTRSELLATCFKVVADPARLRILEALHERHELSVTALTAAVGLGRTNVSNHLACLRWCGFVEARREHRTIFYRVADPRVTELLTLGRALVADNATRVAGCRRVDQEDRAS